MCQITVSLMIWLMCSSGSAQATKIGANASRGSYDFYAGCSNGCPPNFLGLHCKDYYDEEIACKNCTMEQCQGYAKGNDSYGFSYLADNRNICSLCDESEILRLSCVDYLPHGVYIKSTDIHYVETELTVKGTNLIQWKLGSCRSPIGVLGINTGKQFFQKCHLRELDATLVCAYTGWDGSGLKGIDWRGGFLKIEGHKFCDVFFERGRIKLITQKLLSLSISRNKSVEEGIQSSTSDPKLIPRVAQCQEGTRLVEYTQRYDYYLVKITYYCSCGQFCRWDICRLDNPPNECLAGTQSHWLWDVHKHHWVAQVSKDNGKNNDTIRTPNDRNRKRKTVTPKDPEHIYKKNLDKTMRTIGAAKNAVLLASWITFTAAAAMVFLHSPTKIELLVH